MSLSTCHLCSWSQAQTSDFRPLKRSVILVFNGSVESLLTWKEKLSNLNKSQASFLALNPSPTPPSPHRHRHHRGCSPSCWSGRRSCPCPCTRPGASQPASQGRSACEMSSIITFANENDFVSLLFSIWQWSYNGINEAWQNAKKCHLPSISSVLFLSSPRLPCNTIFTGPLHCVRWKTYPVGKLEVKLVDDRPHVVGAPLAHRGHTHGDNPEEQQPAIFQSEEFKPQDNGDTSDDGQEHEPEPENNINLD